MKKILLTTMFGALFVSSSLEAAVARAGTTTGKVDVSVGAAFTSNAKVKGKTKVGKVKTTDAVAAAAAAANVSVFKPAVAAVPGGAAAVPAGIPTISDATANTSQKTGAAIDLNAGGTYWLTDACGIGLDFGFGAYNAKIEDDVDHAKSKISTSFSIMPTATYFLNDNLSLTIGAGVAWTKVKDLVYTPELASNAPIALTGALDGALHESAVQAADTPAFMVTLKQHLATWLGTAAMKGKYINVDVETTAGADAHATFVGGVAAKLAAVADAINAHNAAILDSHKSFKTKPCFTAKANLSYVLGENSKLGLSYQYKAVKSKVKDLGHEFKTNMHVVSVSYSYHF